ncbi:hypothetical protein FOA52_013319 [Chlamydomonas sp. UWO 241]|nr:hypothetical protein FOA52_013319 [Chlamydomonas sp. UWO 241]
MPSMSQFLLVATLACAVSLPGMECIRAGPVGKPMLRGDARRLSQVIFNVTAKTPDFWFSYALAAEKAKIDKAAQVTTDGGIVVDETNVDDDPPAVIAGIGAVTVVPVDAPTPAANGNGPVFVVTPTDRVQDYWFSYALAAEKAAIDKAAKVTTDGGIVVPEDPVDVDGDPPAVILAAPAFTVFGARVEVLSERIAWMEGTEKRAYLHPAGGGLPYRLHNFSNAAFCIEGLGGGAIIDATGTLVQGDVFEELTLLEVNIITPAPASAITPACDDSSDGVVPGTGTGVVGIPSGESTFVGTLEALYDADATAPSAPVAFVVHAPAVYGEEQHMVFLDLSPDDANAQFAALSAAVGVVGIVTVSGDAYQSIIVGDGHGLRATRLRLASFTIGDASEATSDAPQVSAPPSPAFTGAIEGVVPTGAPSGSVPVAFILRVDATDDIAGAVHIVYLETSDTVLLVELAAAAHAAATQKVLVAAKSTPEQRAAFLQRAYYQLLDNKANNGPLMGILFWTVAIGNVRDDG